MRDHQRYNRPTYAVEIGDVRKIVALGVNVAPHPFCNCGPCCDGTGPPWLLLTMGTQAAIDDDTPVTESPVMVITPRMVAGLIVEMTHAAGRAGWGPLLTQLIDQDTNAKRESNERLVSEPAYIGSVDEFRCVGIPRAKRQRDRRLHSPCIYCGGQTNWYCEPCNKVVCATCFATSHRKKEGTP